MSNLDVHSVQQ